MDLYGAAALLSGNSFVVEQGLTDSEQQQLAILKLHPERCLLGAWEGVRSRLNGESVSSGPAALYVLRCCTRDRSKSFFNIGGAASFRHV